VTLMALSMRIISWLLVVLTIAYLFSEVSCVVITLKFDGSLRHPTDGGIPTATLGRMASCACCISCNDKINEYPLLLGGKGLCATSTMTSGEVEYEGLLFAMKSLRSYLSKYSTTTRATQLTIFVQGDCKNVLNQMSGKAIPRKLEPYYLRARSEVDEVSQSLLNKYCSCTFEFQHIPRTDNQLCDRTSACIITEKQMKALNDVWSEVLFLEKVGSSLEMFSVTRILDQWFQPETSLIPLSKRLKVYSHLTSIATLTRDFSGLLTVAHQYEEDVRVLRVNAVKTGRRNSDFVKNNTTLYDTLHADAVIYQILAMRALGQQKEAIRKQQKKRVFLERFSSKLSEMEKQFCASPEPPIANDVSKSIRIEETTHDLRNGVDWPAPVLRWLNEALQSQAWKDNQEWISFQHDDRFPKSSKIIKVISKEGSCSN
jgi:ribonuclease HI